MSKEIDKIADDIMRSAQLAAVLEVSGWPKPGNVHRTADFADTRFEHFMAGAIALGPSIREVAYQGIRVAQRRLQIDEISVGKYIKDAVSEVGKSHKSGNTHLGISLLFAPLAAAAGLTAVTKKDIDSRSLRENVIKVMKATTSEDAADAYDAINLASSAALGRLELETVPDLSDNKAKAKLSERKISLFEVMQASAGWDNIAREWATGMEICFETGYLTLTKVYQETHDINIATVHAFLAILSTFPDTFIARKVGVRETPYIGRAVEIGIRRIGWITETAGRILKEGGLATELGHEALLEFDRKLQGAGGLYNPGTTADLTAGSLFVALLCGLRF